MPSRSLVLRRLLRSDFAPEWAGVGAVTLLAAAWAMSIGFHLRVAFQDGAVFLPATALILAAHFFASRRFSLIAEYFTLILVATTALTVLSYLAMASSGPLFDRQLLAADQALGLDWLASFRWLLAHPLAYRSLQVVYGTLVYQGLYFCVLFGLMERKQDLREMFWLLVAACLLTCAGGLLFPAFGTFKTFGFTSLAAYLPDMERLRSGHDLNFELSRLTGVISFPSFHTTMALAYTYGFRRAGAIGWLVAALNLVMLFSIPFFGGHYFVDMIAGAGVMLAALGLVRLAPLLRNPAAAPAKQQAALAN